MPFTLAHPAIVLPFGKSKKVSLTAMIAGSMVPDFEFFFQMKETENIGHHWNGVLLFDLPMALIFCYLYHNILRDILILNLPPVLRQRFASFLAFDWNKYASENFGKVIISLLLGVGSHLIWDGFTHHDGMFVEFIPALSAITPIKGLPVYFLLQISFSILGLIVVAVNIFQLPKNQIAHLPRVKSQLYWPVFLLFFTSILAFRILLWSQYNTFWGVFMAVMGAVCYAWILVSLILKNQTSC